MTKQLRCHRCGAILSEDDISANLAESTLSYPGDWESDDWVCFGCFISAEVEAAKQ